MTITVADITNRALQLIGTRTTVTTAELVAGSTNEAIQSNLVYASIRDWCLGAVNWNFARRTAALTLLKNPAPPAASPWTSAKISPPWKYEYAIPADSLMIRYITNSDVDSSATYFLGEPKRFVVAIDTIAAVDNYVILTNEPAAVAIYTATMTDPTFWPWYFERLVVSSLAEALTMALTGDRELTKRFSEMVNNYFTIAQGSSLSEGLSFGDTTPEWIQATGINFPFRRPDGKQTTQDRPNDNRR